MSIFNILTGQERDMTELKLVWRLAFKNYFEPFKGEDFLKGSSYWKEGTKSNHY